jgi:hypothetical protein
VRQVVERQLPGAHDRGPRIARRWGSRVGSKEARAGRLPVERLVVSGERRPAGDARAQDAPCQVQGERQPAQAPSERGCLCLVAGLGRQVEQHATGLGVGKRVQAADPGQPPPDRRLGVATGHQDQATGGVADPAGAVGHGGALGRQHVRLVRVVEHQEPWPGRPLQQRPQPVGRVSRLTGERLQVCPARSQPAGDRDHAPGHARYVRGRHPPHRPVGLHLPGQRGGHGGLAHPAHPGQDHHASLLPEPAQQVILAVHLQRQPSHRHRHRCPRRAGIAGRRRLGLLRAAGGELDQGLVEPRLQLRRRADPGHREAGLLEPAPEFRLPRAVLEVDELIGRKGKLGCLVEEEDQAWHLALGGHLELQLGIGQLRPVPDRGSVSESDDADVDIRGGDLAAAVLGGLEIASGEVGHVGRPPIGPRDRGLGRADKSTGPGILPHLGGVAQEHPPHAVPSRPIPHPVPLPVVPRASVRRTAQARRYMAIILRLAIRPPHTRLRRRSGTGPPPPRPTPGRRQGGPAPRRGRRPPPAVPAGPARPSRRTPASARSASPGAGGR